MKKFTASFLECVRKRSIISLRAGNDHPKFTGIWMVVVNDRIFGRSYYMKERSWYHTFLQEKSGEIKCGDLIVKVKGVKPEDAPEITGAINAAYEEKYSAKPNNRVWIDGLKHHDRVAHTLEFIAQS